MSETLHAEDVVQDTLREAWELFRDEFVLFLVAGLILAVVSVVTLGLLSAPLTVGVIQLVDRRQRDQPATATDVFDGFQRFGASFVAMILITIGVLVGSMFFVLPGVLFGLAMAFSFPAIAIDDENATGAMGRSWTIVREHFALAAVFLLIVLVLNGIGGAVLFGTLVTLPFSLVLLTLAYKRLPVP